MAEILKRRANDMSAERRVTADEIRALQDAERGVHTPVFDLATADCLIRNGFSEADVVSILGYMPDLDLTIDETKAQAGACRFTIPST